MQHEGHLEKFLIFIFLIYKTMSELLFVLVSGGLSIVTQFAKKQWPKLDPLFIVAIFAVLGGLIWTGFMEIASEKILMLMGGMWATAVLIYDVVAQVKKKLDSLGVK